MPLPARHHDNHPREPWEPFREIAELHQRMSRLMDSMWSTGGDGLWSPPADLEETDDAWIVEAELPGVKKEDVEIELSGSGLSITGEIDEREHSGPMRSRGRRRGRFDYRLDLPGKAEPDGVEAALKEGILTVRIPKPEQARPKRIEIKA